MENILLNQKGYGTKILKASYNLFKKNWKTLILMSVVLLALQVIPEFFGESYIIAIVSSIINVIVGLGFMYSVLSLVDGNQISFKEMFTRPSIKDVVFVFLASLVASILTLIGYILLIVPGIILTFGLSQATYLIIDKKAGIIESLKKSWKITNGYKWRIFVIGFRAGLIAIAGLLALGVGIFVALPIVYLMYAKTYRDLVLLSENDQATSTDVPETQNESIESEEVEIEVEEILEGDQTEK